MRAVQFGNMSWTNMFFLLLCGQMPLVFSSDLSNRHLTIAADVWRPFWMIYCSDGKEKEWDVPCPGKLPISIMNLACNLSEILISLLFFNISFNN